MIRALRRGGGVRVARVAALVLGILLAGALVLALVRPALAQEQSPPSDSQVPVPDVEESLPDGDDALPDGDDPLPDGDDALPDSEIPGATTQEEPPGEGDTPAAGVTCQGRPATIIGTDGGTEIDGTEGADVIVAGDGQDEIDGKEGDDVICAGDGDGARQDDTDDDDEVEGGGGSDTINGGSGNDTIDGQGGDDTLFGDDEQATDGYVSTADEIDGGDGDDEIDGRADQDVVRGEDGEDTITSRGDGVAPGGGGLGSMAQPITIIDVVIGGSGRDDCTVDEDDDVSECGDEDGDDDSGGDDDGDDGKDENDDGNGSDGDAESVVSAVLPPFCLPRTASVGRLGIGRLFLGGNVVETLIGAGELPFPLPRRSLRFCVEGGGVTLVAFSPIGRAEVILSTGPGRSARGVNPGDPASAIRRSYPDALRIESPAGHSGARLYRASPTSRIFFGVRGGRVVFVGVASRLTLSDGPLLARHLRLVPLPAQP